MIRSAYWLSRGADCAKPVSPGRLHDAARPAYQDGKFTHAWDTIAAVPHQHRLVRQGRAENNAGRASHLAGRTACQARQFKRAGLPI